jgi:hypothetical protein
MKPTIVKLLPLVIFTHSLCAVSVVLYDSTLGQGSGNFATPSVQTFDINSDTYLDNRLTNAFSSVTPLNNGVASYTGPDIFGGLTGDALRGSDGSGTPDSGFDTRALSAFSWRHQVSAPITGNVHAVLYFKVNGASYPTGVTLGATNWFGFSSLADGSVDGVNRFENTGTVRFMLATSDGAFYVSSSAAADSADGRVLDGTELATESWQLFNPAVDMNFDQGSATFGTSTADLNAIGIAGFGLVVDKDSYSSDRHWLDFTRFYAEASPIPEPSTLALASLASLAGLLVFRRRRTTR